MSQSSGNERGIDEDSTCAEEADALAGFYYAQLDGSIRCQAQRDSREVMLTFSRNNSLEWPVSDSIIEERAKIFISLLQPEFMMPPLSASQCVTYWQAIRNEHTAAKDVYCKLLDVVRETLRGKKTSAAETGDSPMKITDVSVGYPQDAHCEAIVDIGAPPGLQLPSPVHSKMAAQIPGSQMGQPAPIMVEPISSMDAVNQKQGSPAVIALSEKKQGDSRTRSLVELDAVGGWDFENAGDSQNKFTFPVRASQFKTTNRTLTLDKFEARIGDRLVPFQLHITADHVSEKRHGWSFKKALGFGKIDVKCREENPPECEVAIMLFIARGVSSGQRPRQVTHNFAERPSAALPQQQDLWDFLGAQDRNGQVLVSVELK